MAGCRVWVHSSTATARIQPTPPLVATIDDSWVVKSVAIPSRLRSVLTVELAGLLERESSRLGASTGSNCSVETLHRFVCALHLRPCHPSHSHPRRSSARKSFLRPCDRERDRASCLGLLRSCSAEGADRKWWLECELTNAPSDSCLHFPPSSPRLLLPPSQLLPCHPVSPLGCRCGPDEICRLNSAASLLFSSAPPCRCESACLQKGLVRLSTPLAVPRGSALLLPSTVAGFQLRYACPASGKPRTWPSRKVVCEWESLRGLGEKVLRWSGGGAVLAFVWVGEGSVGEALQWLPRLWGCEVELRRSGEECAVSLWPSRGLERLWGDVSLRWCGADVRRMAEVLQSPRAGADAALEGFRCPLLLNSARCPQLPALKAQIGLVFVGIWFFLRHAV